jgi:hypothetical protein
MLLCRMSSLYLRAARPGNSGIVGSATVFWRHTIGHKRAEKKLKPLEADDRTPNYILTAVNTEHGLQL